MKRKLLRKKKLNTNLAVKKALFTRWWPAQKSTEKPA